MEKLQNKKTNEVVTVLSREAGRVYLEMTDGTTKDYSEATVKRNFKEYVEEVAETVVEQAEIISMADALEQGLSEEQDAELFGQEEVVAEEVVEEQVQADEAEEQTLQEDLTSQIPETELVEDSDSQTLEEDVVEDSEALAQFEAEKQAAKEQRADEQLNPEVKEEEKPVEVVDYAKEYGCEWPKALEGEQGVSNLLNILSGLDIGNHGTYYVEKPKSNYRCIKLGKKVVAEFTLNKKKHVVVRLPHKMFNEAELKLFTENHVDKVKVLPKSYGYSLDVEFKVDEEGLIGEAIELICMAIKQRTGVDYWPLIY